jgi:lysophospholipase L1-like esterase
MVALVGHSMLDQAIQVGAISPRSVSLHWRGVPAWISVLSYGQFSFPESCKFAVSGANVKDIYATAVTTNNNTTLTGTGTQLSYCLACKASIVYVHIGHNDIVNNFSFGRIVNGIGDDNLGLTYIVNQLVSSGKVVILSSELPSGNSSFTSTRYTSAQLAIALQFRDWVVNKAQTIWPGMVYGIDYWPVMANRAGSSLGDNYATITYDGIHPTALGGYAMAKKALPVFQSLGAPIEFAAIHQPGDLYDATNNPRGNLIPNGDMLGSAALSGTTGGVTLAGVRPTSWSVGSNSALQAGSGITVTGSQVTGTVTGDWYQVVATGTTSSNAIPAFYVQNLNASLSNMNVGDYLQAFGEFEINSGSTGIRGVRCLLSSTAPGGNNTATLLDVDIFSNTNPSRNGVIDTIVAGANLSGVFNGNINIGPWIGSETVMTLQLSVVLAESSAFNVTTRFRNAASRKVV